MNIDLSYKQKNIIIGIIVLVVLLILFIALINPVFSKNSTLNNQINNQQEIKNLLSKTKKQLQNSKVFPALSQDEAKKIIRIRLNVQKTIRINDNKITAIIKKQNFNRLINSINLLKNNYGIVVIKADINKVADGLVDANLTFSHL